MPNQDLHQGETVELTLKKGDSELAPIRGTLRTFRDDEGKTRWEISTGDLHHPAVGFVPSNVVTVKRI